MDDKQLQMLARDLQAIFDSLESLRLVQRGETSASVIAERVVQILILHLEQPSTTKKLLRVWRVSLQKEFGGVFYQASLAFLGAVTGICVIIMILLVIPDIFI